MKESNTKYMKKRKIGFMEKEEEREEERRRIEKYLKTEREGRKQYRTVRLRYPSTFSTTLSPYPDSREKKVARNFRLTSG